ncbi:MAG: energy transducer TonB [Chitinophaga sp.]|uniref:energy transducer TonB n=1 Tax=Chitinophaga sp. TaxID=1869181 RepID=UPI001B11D766|nr:energy transducer TonB [Chitinophaga sp.]MBO9727587.1 energy transducer TonB [Chitinophaga sp.]
MPFKYLFPVVAIVALAATQTPVSGNVSVSSTAAADSNPRPIRRSGDTTFYDNGYVFVERPPVYPGGWEKIDMYLADNIRYPKAAWKANVGGIVRVKFILDSTGQVTKVQALDSLGYGLEEEATRVVQKMKRWQPGMQQGKPVNVEFMLPIRFSIRQ